MSTSRSVFLLCLATGGSWTLGLEGASASIAPIPVSELASAPAPLAAWDPASPQQLVRIGPDLYQEDAGFYYRVIEDHVTVRLAEGVPSWSELLQRVLAGSPRLHARLLRLEPVRHNRLGIVDLAIPDGSPADWAELLFHTGWVRYAEVATYGTYTITVNDPLYPQQWALNNTGQTGGTPGADVDAEKAWEITTGNPAVIVGILDSGTDVDHVDLAANVWLNEDELPGNGIDDDGNGFIDDWIGWDFENNNNDPNGTFFHGTHVTGIVNAVGHNGLGVAGLAGGRGTPGVRGMAIGVGSNSPVGSIIDDSLIYATDNGARVITLSLTVGSSSAINNALSYAYSQNDVFIDCASGNNGSAVGYPANRPEVMAVASTTHNDAKSSFSNPGPEVEVAAPGSDIWSTQLNNTYGTSSGTSFAAPYVGALAALIRGVNPSLTAPQVRQLIIDTADDVGAPGFDVGTGWGRIDAFEAVSEAGTSDGTIDLDAGTYSCSSTLTVSVTDFDLAGLGAFAVKVRSGVESAGESVLVTENETGLFSGTLPLAAGSAAPDGVLQVGHADLVTAEYVDDDDGQGGVDVLKTDTATTDCAGPQIFGVGAVNVDNAFATILWTTDEPGTSVVRYGSAVPPDQQAASATLTTDHVLVLSGLAPCTSYKFEIESTDALGNTGSNDNGGAYFSFQTLGNFPGVGVVPCQQGQAQLDRFVYGCSDMALASVIDIGPNTNPGAAEEIEALLTSTTEPAGEWIVLTETGSDTGRFEGEIALGAVNPAADGTLAVSAGDAITVTYFDGDGGQGTTHIATATSTTDCTPPVIQGIQVTAISATRAVIEWTTSEPATSRVEFGADSGLGWLAEDLALETTHAVAISAFDACDRAYFRVSGADAYGELALADAEGQPFAFNLNEIGGLVFHDNFEGDSGWELAGEWQIGAPEGQGSSSGDPQVPYSGSGVLGIDLTGTGAFPGDYEPSTAHWAFSPQASSLGATALELIMRRKLGVVAGDSAQIVVEKGLGQFVWKFESGADDQDWVELRQAIPIADNAASFRIGFGLNAGPAGQSYGWNVDELIVKESSAPDYLACGNCGGAPSFGGLATAYDPAPCAASGVALDWPAAPAWGTGTSGTYEVHRATTSDFLPDAKNLLASGLTATTWLDESAPLDVPVWYVVRARNDEDCSAGGGLTDDNLIRRAATETVSQPIPADLGWSLRVTGVGAAHVRLSWDPVPQAHHYVVLRASLPNFAATEVIGTTAGTFYEDLGAANDGNTHYYRVFPANSCGQAAP